MFDKMPIYQIFGVSQVSESVSNEIVAAITDLHSNILGSAINEVVCILMPDARIMRGGENDLKHIRIFGYIASGRSTDIKNRFFKALKERLQPLFNEDLIDFTFAVNLIEMGTSSSSRITGARVAKEDKEWGEMVIN